MRILSIYLLLVVALVSCKSDTSKTKEVSALETAKAAMEQSPGVPTATTYLTELSKSIPTSNDKLAKLKEGLVISEKYKLAKSAISFLTPLVKDYSNDADAPAFKARLASLLYDMNRKEAGDILTTAYLQSNPEGTYAQQLKDKAGEISAQPTETLEKMATAVFENPDKFGINRNNAQRYVDACEAYALAYPQSEEAPLYLYRGAEMARTLRTFGKALSLYDWIAEKYPNYEKTPTTLFLKGFMLENELNDKAKAKEVYQSFIKNYPNHELVDDINFLLENIDKSDKEIMEMIENKKGQEG